MKRLLIMVGLLSASSVTPVLAADCTCLKNGDGKCMTLAKGMYSYRTFDEYLMGPHCVTGCYPGFNDVYGYSLETQKELTACKINWTRLRHQMGRDAFPEWKSSEQ